MTPQEQLDYERHIAEVIRIRQEKKASSRLELWLNSAALAALIGVLGTALLGAWVAGIVQDRSKRNELELTSRNERRAARNAAVANILRIVGAHLSATDDLIVSVNNAYREQGRTSREVKELQEWKKKIVEARNAAEMEWRKEKRSLGFTLVYLFDNDASINTAWAGVAQIADEFERCTNSWYGLNAEAGSDKEPHEVCPTERSGLDSALGQLTRAVTAASSK